MGVKVENHLKEALELAREASKEKEYFWEKNPYGNPYTVVYGYVALLHKRGRLYGNLDRVSFLMDSMTFRQEVMYTYLPRLFQRCRPDKRYIELIQVALAGEVRKGENFVKEIHMEDDEIFLRIIDMSFYMWDNRFVKSVDKMREIITNKELREKVGLTDKITTEPPVALEEEPQVKPKEEPKEEAKEESKGRPAIKQSDLNPPKFIKDLEKRDLRTGSSPALRGWLTKLPPDVDKSYEDDDEYEDVPTELALDAFKLTSAKVRKIREELSDRIYGQDSCISKFSEGLFHALTTDFGRTTGGPRGVFLFVGPPGVGKTYLAESLAELLKLPYKRFNMSEYASEQDYFQLTGADRTYKNSHEGILSKHINKNPDSIIVFDEIEKAGPKVHNIFLQILGLGEYDDDYTKETINCRDTIMIFTSNAGKELYEGRTGDLSEIPESVIMNNIEKERHPQEDRALINPALCSRFGAGCVILFNHVDEEAKLRIVRNGFDRACAKYSKKTSMKLSYDERLPLLFLFHYSNNLDARKASLKSEAFLEKEIYQISRQLGNQNDLLDRAKEVVFELSLPVDDEIKLFFENNKKTGFLAFCGEEMKALFPEKSEDFEVTFKNTEYDGSEDLKEVAAIFVDPYLGCDTNVWHPIGLDDYDCAGMNTLNKIVDSKVGIPVYLLDNKGHISPTDRESLLQLGARGFVNLGEGDENTTLKSLAQTLYISKQCRKLSQKGYILDYDCAIESADDGKKVIVSFYDMWKTQAMDETTGQVALRDEERPDVGLGDVIGAGSAKEELKYYIEYLKDPLKFLQKTGHHPKGLLLYGPPGTGKTMLARALAGETDCSFFQVAASELVSSYAGESKDKVKELFARARKYAPSIIFIDEIDAIGRDRSLGNTESG
ncbi:MAG: AAA family ATPase, partial [Butyrivibrio sp.]|nr:AAA family ATPase [Butyrivibrio sp.]